MGRDGEGFEGVHRREWWTRFGYVVRRLEALWHHLAGAAALGDDAVVLDYGCGEQPYRPMFPASATYLGADLPGNPVAAVTLGDDGSVPLGDGEVDAIVSSQVLEHVTDPALYLAECRRLLRPGGALLLSTHGLMYLHPDPTDYWRWTCDGLVKAVEDAGFEVVELQGLLGLPATGVFLLQEGLRPRVPAFLRPALYLCFQLAAAGLDRLMSDEGRRRDALVFGIRATPAGPR